jgi:hypothetical protein
MKELKERVQAKTPEFWKKIQRIGIVVGTVGTIILTCPVALPVGIVTASGYLVAVGGVAAALSQLTKE